MMVYSVYPGKAFHIILYSILILDRQKLNFVKPVESKRRTKNKNQEACEAVQAIRKFFEVAEV